jgi:hypothetical protein
VGGGRLNNLMDRLYKGFDNLMNLDPVLGGNLAVLLRALAVLDPENAEQLLDKVADTLDSLANLTGSQSAPSSSVNVPAAQSAQTSGAQQGSAQWVHFEMDFEIEMSAVTETTVAELRDQGLQCSDHTSRTNAASEPPHRVYRRGGAGNASAERPARA